jgi:serine/threonine protein kinase
LTAPATITDFLELVRKSGVVEEKRLEAAVRTLRPEHVSAEPAQLAQAMINAGLLTRFHAEQILRGRIRGFTLGNYKVLERLGSGGMAQVFLCEDAAKGQRVAIKVLPGASAQNEELLKRFQREARAASGLDHPNIVRTYEIDKEGKHHFQVMEYVDGAGLHELVQKFGPLSVARAAHYIRQAALALQHAFEAGMVHRDIKPGNLMVDRTGNVKVLDMGMALLFSESEEVLTQGMLGTPDFVAPEQCRDSHNVDIRADIYSLGCTFYYLLTGNLPFPEGTFAEKLHWQQTQPPIPVRSRRPEVPERLAAVVHRMMAKKPEQRYQTPLEVAEALTPWTLRPIPAPREEEMPQLCRAVRGPADPAPVLVITPVTRQDGANSAQVWPSAETMKPAGGKKEPPTMKPAGGKEPPTMKPAAANKEPPPRPASPKTPLHGQRVAEPKHSAPSKPTRPLPLPVRKAPAWHWVAVLGLILAILVLLVMVGSVLVRFPFR